MSKYEELKDEESHPSSSDSKQDSKDLTIKTKQKNDYC